MRSEQDLRSTLRRIDGRGYRAYKDLEGSYDFGAFALFVDHVQGDPFAAPSRLRLRAPLSRAQIPLDTFDTEPRRRALTDFLARVFAQGIAEGVRGHRGTGKSGLVFIDAGGQEALERSAVVVNREFVEARVSVGLPAAGRTVLGRQAEEVLCGELPELARSSLFWSQLPQDRARRQVTSVADQSWLRDQLEREGLVAFVADGSILPRRSGVDNRPMGADRAIRFQSPGSLQRSYQMPGGSRVVGMGIPIGVTLIVGGGYHGKSTLLKALEQGVYDHIPGDGRECVVTLADAVKIRAEDGRRVERVDISGFIADLPLGSSTTAFSTDDASGSTSQAANIVEAVEIGTKLLLVDEDTSATNFMIRDARMQALITKDREPITPFLDRVRELYELHGVSTILVMGGSGDYFDAADTVIAMNEYRPEDVTEKAKAVAQQKPAARRKETSTPMPSPASRSPLPDSFDPSRGRRPVKIDAHGLHTIRFGSTEVDLRCVEQVVDPSQTNAISQALFLALRRYVDGHRVLSDVVTRLEADLTAGGLDLLSPYVGQHPGNLARPRKYEVAAAINRMRTLRVTQTPRSR